MVGALFFGGIGGFACKGFRHRGVSELFLESHGIAGDVSAALFQEKPEKQGSEDTNNRKGDFGREGPGTGIEHPDGDHKHQSEVDVATEHNEGFGEFEIAADEGMFGAIVGMAHEFAVDDKLEDGGEEGVGDEDGEAGWGVYAKCKKEHGGEGE